MQRERERERERERCARALGEQDLARLYQRFSETRFGRFFEGKNVAKGVCNVAKLATLCISISPIMGWATGQTENTRCVNRALKKLVPLKRFCVNALLTVLLQNYEVSVFSLSSKSWCDHSDLVELRSCVKGV